MPFFGHPWSCFIAKNVCVACSCHKYKRINNTHADPNFTSPCVATKTRNYSLILSFHLLFLTKKIYRTYKTIQTIFCLIWFYFRGLPSYKNLKLGIFSFAIFMNCKLWNWISVGFSTTKFWSTSKWLIIFWIYV